MSKIVIGNQKMYMNKTDVLAFVDMLKQTNMDNKEVIVCPTYPFLEYYNDTVPVGAQNVSINDNGAYTGEVSVSQLKSLNIPYCIVGHSERREYQKETFEDINEKVKRLFENDIVPILCIGESKEQRENTDFKAFLEDEITTAIEGLTEDQINKIVIAYEPIWSIGTGIIPTTEEIIEVFDFIKEKLPNTKVLYGGSANVNNIEMLNKIKQIDGYLLGGLSLKPDDLQKFLDIMKD